MKKIIMFFLINTINMLSVNLFKISGDPDLKIFYNYNSNIKNIKNYSSAIYNSIKGDKALAYFPLDKKLNNNFVVYLDPGHGGKDDGAAYHGLKEKDLALKISKKIFYKLKKKNIPVKLTRSTDKDLSLADRASISQKSHGLFVSVHLNSAPNFAVQGIETFYTDPNILQWQSPKPKWLVDSKDFANIIHNNLIYKSNSPDRGVKTGCPIVLVSNMHMPAVLIECGFISNKIEANRLATDQYQDDISSKISNGIQQYYNKIRSV